MPTEGSVIAAFVIVPIIFVVIVAFCSQICRYCNKSGLSEYSDEEDSDEEESIHYT